MKRSPIARGRGAKSKGQRGEAEAIGILREIGFDARRNFRSGASGGGDALGVPDHHVEIKRCERVTVWEWISQAMAAKRPTEVAVVMFRRNLSPWFVVLPAEDYFGMVKELQELRGQ